MVRWEWNVVKVASELGSHSSRHAWQQCFPGCCWACEGWCVWTLFFLYCLGMVCRARTRWQNLGLQYVRVQTGVLGRKRLGSSATLLGQSSRPKWFWVPWCRTRYIQEFKSASLACSQQLPLTEKKWTTPPPGVFKINVDGAMSENERNSNVGVVIRDAIGTVSIACCKYLQGKIVGGRS